MHTRDHRTRAPIVAAFSPATGAREPVEFGVAASRITGAPLIVVAVADTGSLHVHFGADEAPVLPAAIGEPLRNLQEDMRRRGLSIEVRAFEDTTAARGVARAIDEFQPELVVIGSTARGEKGWIMTGNTAQRVIHISACPVAVVPNGYVRPEGGVAVIGVAYTPTPEGADALTRAVQLARAGGVRLKVITAVREEDAEEARLALTAQLGDLAGDLETELDVTVEEPTAALAAASEHVDLLMMGSRGLGPRRAVILGSVSRRVIDQAACPVLVLPRGSADRSEALLADAATQGSSPE